MWLILTGFGISENKVSLIIIYAEILQTFLHYSFELSVLMYQELLRRESRVETMYYYLLSAGQMCCYHQRLLVKRNRAKSTTTKLSNYSHVMQCMRRQASKCA